MGLGDCLRCVKYLLFVFNLIFCLVGLAILAIGILICVSPALFSDLSGLKEASATLHVIGIGIIVIGSIITVLGFLGCCGAIFQNRVLLVLFFILVLLIFICLLAIGVYGVIKKDGYRDSLEHTFTVGMKAPDNSTEKKIVNDYQVLSRCCGWKSGETDYTDSGYTVPPSCHHNTTQPAVPCSKRYDETLGKHFVPFIIATFVTAAVSLLGLIFSMMLCCAITDLS